MCVDFECFFEPFNRHKLHTCRQGLLLSSSSSSSSSSSIKAQVDLINAFKFPGRGAITFPCSEFWVTQKRLHLPTSGKRRKDKGWHLKKKWRAIILLSEQSYNNAIYSSAADLTLPLLLTHVGCWLSFQSPRNRVAFNTNFHFNVVVMI